MGDGAAAGRSGQLRLARERYIWSIRVAAVGFVAFQNMVAPGDDIVLSWAIFVFLAVTVAIAGPALAGRPDDRRVRVVGAATMAADVAASVAIMANNLTDSAEPVYLIGVLAMLEATIRWRRWGGIIGGTASGLAAGAWTVAVAERTEGRLALDHATMRAGVLIGLGVFLGFLIRRVTEQHDTLQGVLDTSRDLIVSLDDRGVVLSVNAASERLLGYAPQEMVGRHYRDFFHPEDVNSALPPRLSIPPGQTVHYERRVRSRDGSLRWLELQATPVAGTGTILGTGRDVTERREAQHRIEESEQRFRSLFDHNSDAVYALDLDGRFTMMNPAGERITGYRVDEVVGAGYDHLMAPEELEAARARFVRAAAGEALTYETAIHHRDGRYIEIDVTNLPIVVDGDVVGVFGIAKDVTHRRRLERQLGHQATHDALTGLPNRAHLESSLVEAAVGEGERSLLFIDLDRFKLVNDSLGHRSGDELLVAAVERLRSSVRSDDLLARWAGDEFCVLLAPGTTDAVALQVAERLRSVLAEPFTIAGRDVRLSASIGVASAGADDVERLVQVADLAMYAAKRAGRDRVSVYEPSSVAAVTQLDLEGDLAAALDAGEVSVHYQPIVETASGRIGAVEALARWTLADGTRRSPAEFITVAEESGLIRQLTRQILADACRQLARWDRLGGPGAGALQAWVNVSVADLESSGFAAEVEAALRAAGLRPGRLVLEVTETTLMRDADQVDITIADLGVLGVALAIDDFGTGYSSLSRLHRLPVAACKIDRHFVAHAPERAADTLVLRALVEVGRAFDVAVVAEGIERPEELSAAIDAGCTLAQGFLLGVPSPPAALDELLGAGRIELAALASGSAAEAALTGC